MPTPTFQCPEQAAEAFQRDGATVLRGVLTRAEVALLAQGIEHNLAQPGPLALVASGADDPGRFVEDFCNWQRIPAYRRILCESALPGVAAALMRSRTVRLYHDHLLVKEAGTRQPTPWHQDQPYYNISGRQNVSFWIPVDPVPEASSLRFVAGSHTGIWYMPRSFRDHQARWFAEGTLAEMPPIDAEPQRHAQRVWALQPGDAVAFHMLTLHASAGVGPQGRRRVFSARYLGDDCRHAVRPWRTSPPFPGLAERLAHAAPMEDPLFPLVWPAQ